MLNNDIIRIVKPKLEEMLLELYLVEAKFKQGFQRLKVGANIDNVVYYYPTANTNIGLPKRSSFFDNDSGKMNYQEKQILETTFQINSLVPENDIITATDLLVYVRIIFEHLDFINYLKDNNLSIYKPTAIRSGWFETDNGGYENNPSFDVTFHHEQVTNSFTNFVSKFENIFERI